MMTKKVESRVLTDNVGEPILQKIDKALCELSNARDDVETGKHQSAVLSFLRMAKEYIEDVRDDIEVVTSAYFDHLSQPQPVAQGEAVAWQYRCITEEGPSPVWHTIDKEIYDRWRETSWSRMEFRELYAAPTIPTGHRVVPEQPLEAADERAAFERWVRSHFKYPNLDIDTRYPGYYADKMTAGAWEAWQERAASPSAGGV